MKIDKFGPVENKHVFRFALIFLNVRAHSLRSQFVDNLGHLAQVTGGRRNEEVYLAYLF